ncbi:retrotransposon protein, putative, ty1-copia subclass [Tanacetum coccineum]
MSPLKSSWSLAEELPSLLEEYATQIKEQEGKARIQDATCPNWARLAMQKLQRDGLLGNINDIHMINANLYSGKDYKKPFNNNIERATDLLGLIHTDVCGPFRHVSRKGASYFLTFTDDFSRYGYVYLLKHKHEVFETFKVFKSEVELQLGKRRLKLFDPIEVIWRFSLKENLISQEFSGRDYDLEEDHMDALPSENTSEIPVEPESLGPPPKLIPIRRSERNKSAPNRLNLNIEVEDDVVGDLGEPANYKAAML